MKLIHQIKLKKNIYRYLIAILVISNFAFLEKIVAQDEALPLNLDTVEVALRSKKTDLITKNKLLIEGANNRKTTFIVTPEIEKRLRLFGASNGLISALKTYAPQSRVIPKTSANTTVKNSIGMELVLIPKGEFMMGTKDEEKSVMLEKQHPRHKVVIKQDFYMGKYEVTQAQWKAIMGKNPSTYDLCGENCPVESISWETVKKFLDKLNQKNDGYKYRLPTEAEWEYAARAGTDTNYYWGNDLGEKDYIYYASSNHQHPVRVGAFLPNGFGLYDMGGNVWEFCEDVWQDSYKNAPTDGTASRSGEANRIVMRGGGYGNYYDEWRSDMRRFFEVKEIMYNLGFRVVATPAR